MNKQQKSATSRGIEWTEYTWNPVRGCQHSCRWQMPDGSIAVCYAETVAERVAGHAYPHGFEHHYWNPKLLDEPLKHKTPARIFLDSMSDLMGAWVPDDEIQQVLDICRKADWHTFQLLTKNAPRLLKFKFPPNVWVGVSAPPSFMFGKELTFEQQQRMVKRQLETLAQVDVPVRWMSIEPLSFDIAPLLENSPLEWAVIGAATNGNKTYQPEKAWVENVLRVLDAQGTAVFFKGNLKWDTWREEFPTPKPANAKFILPSQSTALPQQRKLWHDHEAEYVLRTDMGAPTRVIPRWDWQGIWTRGNFVYALDEWRDRHGNWRAMRDKRGLHQFVEVLPGSVRAEKWRRQLESMWTLNPGAWSGWTRKLRQFLYDGQWRPIQDARPIPNALNIVDAAQARSAWLPMAQIIPTEPEYDMWIRWQYIESGRLVDAKGHLPYGLRFAGDDAVYLVDGHHRLMAERYRGRMLMQADVQDVPYSLDWAWQLAGKVETLEAVYATTA